ncbi:LOW QUALITY PROTEIN: hypothetical protein PHPALM_15386 [Phytophthora palmivora]|uniref:HTH CENPB-type domain-containing protein n=1 Tax=Phytophthora palmivora TaxID=4796 RepID=A0A2P4XSC0_9STRA|nr:LOW QUALITY PROTEIN: hypothetical protein PHPALM_15386 [Phytophthora palmivora]
MAPKQPPKGRVNIKGVHRKPKQFLRNSVSNDKKVRIIEYFRSHGMSATVAKFYPTISKEHCKTKKRQIYKWIEKESVIGDAIEKGGGSLHKNRNSGLSTVLTVDDEDQLAHWVRDMRREGVPVSPFMLECRAKEVAEDAGVPTDSFAASSSWRKRFLDKYCLALRRKTRIGQNTPADSDQIAREFRSKKIEEEGIVEIYNADETAMNYEYLPTRTYDARGARTIWIRNAGAEKKRMTVMLLADMHGIRKTPFAVFKQPSSKVKETEEFNRKAQNGFGRTLWKEVCPLMDKHDVQIYCNPKGWWNGELSIKFLRYHFSSRESLGEKILLLWDDFSGHWTSAVEQYAESINVVLMRIPPGYTSTCQPADIAWMKPFKLELRGLWVEYLQQQLRAHQESGAPGKFKLEAPSRATLMTWMTNAWENLSIDTLASGFRKLAIPTDTRAIPLENSRLQAKEVDVLVQKLERFAITEEVENDFGKWIGHFMGCLDEDIGRPIVLACDGCSSHLGYDAERRAKELGVILLCFPPNATHLIQPLDVVVFKTFKSDVIKFMRRV